MKRRERRFRKKEEEALALLSRKKRGVTARATKKRNERGRKGEQKEGRLSRILTPKRGGTWLSRKKAKGRILSQVPEKKMSFPEGGAQLSERRKNPGERGTPLKKISV